MDQPTYFYNKQFKNYLIQIMSVFSIFNVSVGASADREERLINVPVYYGQPDKIVAALKASNTQNKPIRVPCFSAYMDRIDLAPHLRKGVGMVKRAPFLKQGGLFPEDIRVVHQLMPVPYEANFEVSMFCSNTEQQFQLMEQILTLFDPVVMFQTSDDIFDWTRLTKMELIGVSIEATHPAGLERRILTSKFDFKVPVYLSIPAEIKDKYVKDIYLRMGHLAGNKGVRDVMSDEYEILTAIDIQGIEGVPLFELKNIEIE